MSHLPPFTSVLSLSSAVSRLDKEWTLGQEKETDERQGKTNRVSSYSSLHSSLFSLPNAASDIKI